MSQRLPRPPLCLYPSHRGGIGHLIVIYSPAFYDPSARRERTRSRNSPGYKLTLWSPIKLPVALLPHRRILSLNCSSFFFFVLYSFYRNFFIVIISLDKLPDYRSFFFSRQTPVRHRGVSTAEGVWNGQVRFTREHKATVCICLHVGWSEIGTLARRTGISHGICISMRECQGILIM